MYTQRGSLIALADPELARVATREMAEAGGEYVYEHAVAGTPVSYHGRALQFGGFGDEVDREPGTLKRRWKRHPAEPSLDVLHGGWRVVVENDDPIAQYVEWDTKPHPITPKKPGGFLRFRVWPTGELVYTRLVKHPGTRGHHMLGLALHAAELNFEHICQPALRDWARKQEAAAR